MEPMTLGSPNTSMNTSFYDSSAISNSQFLPSFLLGSDQGSSSYTTSPRLASPTKPQVTKFQLSPRDRRIVNNSLPSDKPEGPPTLSLSDYSVMHFQRQISEATDLSCSQSQVKDYIEDYFSENWITVFGFSPSQLDLVLSYFIRFGQIIDKKHSTNGGNWVHIRYSNRREVQKALSHNGKQISSSLMIGVVSRKDKRILDSSQRNSSFQSRADVPNITNFNSPPYSPSIRRLTVANNENEVVPMSNIPTKSTGVVSKTMEYLFGW